LSSITGQSILLQTNFYTMQEKYDAEFKFDSIEDALADFAQGKFVLVMDDEDRENEGDLIIAAEKTRTEDMAFLVRHSSGYICAPTTTERLEQLNLPLMVPKNTELMRTAYTISVDYLHGTTTGISAHDRALTVRKLADLDSKPEDFSRPGHILPLRAVPGGTLKRFGHTEAGVDLCRLAGLSQVAVIGELLKEDDVMGGVARRDDCALFAEKHGLKMITIADLIKYRQSHKLEGDDNL